MIMPLPVADFVRLIQDPAATHIELKGDIVFTHEYFPPENAHDKSKGYNISHKVCLLVTSAWQLSDPSAAALSTHIQQL